MRLWLTWQKQGRDQKIKYRQWGAPLNGRRPKSRQILDSQIRVDPRSSYILGYQVLDKSTEVLLK